MWYQNYLCFQNFLVLHFHRLLCELENAHVLYKIKIKFAFFHSDVFNSLDEIYLVFTSKKQISSMYFIHSAYPLVSLVCSICLSIS